jgi:tetratricopeptide (TPR) repeat protein
LRRAASERKELVSRGGRLSSVGGWAAVGLLAMTLPSCSSESGAPRDARSAPEATPSFVGSAACRDCHGAAWEAWRGSDHDLAMMPATAETVAGDFADATFTHFGVTSRFYRRDGRFFVHTEGPGGVPGEFEITYTFGVRPLQQYLVPFPGGRLQALSIAWDTVGKRWFHLEPARRVEPSDWLHWTRNGQNWNGMCAECHSTNLKKGYDPESATFATTWSEVNVGCEACHGPSSRHVDWARLPPERRAGTDSGLVIATRGISSRRQVEICAACHARRAELGDYDHAAGDFLEQFRPSLLDEGLYESDGQQIDEVYTWGSFVQSRMYARGMHCGDCHDPHAAKLRAPGNASCARCHNPAGTVLRDGIDGAGLQPKHYDSPEHHFHRAGGRGSACVDCHAPPKSYMVVDPRHDHSFRIPRPDLTVKTGAPNACNGCHGDRSAAWAAAAVERWYGPGRRREEHYGETIAAARAGLPEAADPLRRLAADAGQSAIVRATALELLTRYPAEATTTVQRAALRDPDPLLREAAAGAIRIPDPQARLASLGPLLSDPVRAVRLAALSALAGTPRALLDPGYGTAFDLALAEYEATMRYSLDFASSGLNLGNLHASLGQPEEAERYYRQALAVDDLFYPAKANLAVLLSGQGRNDEAERLLREILAAYPDHSDAASSLGLLLVETGRSEEAVDWLRRAVESARGVTRASYNLGLVLAQLGRVEEARATLTAALSREPANWDLLFALADLELRAGRPREALALAERMIAERPADPAGEQIRAAAARMLSNPR